MNTILQNIRNWAWTFDLMTDAFYIEKDRNSVEKEMKKGGEKRCIVNASKLK